MTQSQVKTSSSKVKVHLKEWVVWKQQYDPQAIVNHYIHYLEENGIEIIGVSVDWNVTRTKVRDSFYGHEQWTIKATFTIRSAKDSDITFAETPTHERGSRSVDKLIESVERRTKLR